MPNNCDGLDTCNISPVRPKMKHTSTPVRTRRKTSRREQGVDVHTASCSTPTAHRSPRLQRPSQNSPRFQSTNFNSPSSSFPCSQDNRPDVVWDFTSPQLPKGARKKELKITVQELLENLNQHSASECNSQSAPYIKLLESWMSKQPTEITVKKKENNKEIKKRSRHRIEELRKFIESIQRPKKETSFASNLRSPDDFESKHEAVVCDVSCASTSFKNSFLEGNSTDDSSEELWGDMDSSFIVKATQELDKVTVISTATADQAGEIVSTIPATVPNGTGSKSPATLPNGTGSKSPATVQLNHSCEQYSDLLLQLTKVDWDFDDDDEDEWDKGFLIEDDDLSFIPEDVLSGERITQGEEKENVPDSNSQALKSTRPLETRTVGSAKEDKGAKKKPESVFHISEAEWTVMAQDVPNAELYNSFEDDSFEDESLLCQPEVLSRIDEVESMLSQPKCTPEEIEKKKDEAIKRRKNTHLKKKT